MGLLPAWVGEGAFVRRILSSSCMVFLPVVSSGVYGAHAAAGPAVLASGLMQSGSSSFGPYAIKNGTLHCDSVPVPVPGTESGHRKVLDVIYPVDDTGERFPVVSYLHGGLTPLQEDGENALSDIWRLYASWGFVVLSSNTQRLNPLTQCACLLTEADTPRTCTPA